MSTDQQRPDHFLRYLVAIVSSVFMTHMIGNLMMAKSHVGQGHTPARKRSGVCWSVVHLLKEVLKSCKMFPVLVGVQVALGQGLQGTEMCLFL